MLASAADAAKPAAEAAAPAQKAAPTVTLETADKATFTVAAAALRRSGLVQQHLASADAGALLRVPHVTPAILDKILEFCLARQDDDAEYDEKTYKVADADFEELEAWAPEDLLQFAMAADIMQIPDLTHAAGAVLAKHLNGKNPDDVRAMFDIDGLNEVEEDEDMGAEDASAEGEAPAAKE